MRAWRCQTMLRLWVLTISHWHLTLTLHSPLSTVQQNTGLAGELLVESLLKKVNGEPVESMLLPAKLIVRGSCGAKASKTSGKV